MFNAFNTLRSLTAALALAGIINIPVSALTASHAETAQCESCDEQKRSDCCCCGGESAKPRQTSADGETCCGCCCGGSKA